MNIFKNYNIYFLPLIYFTIIHKPEPKIAEVSNKYIYNLRINHLKEPFAIDVKNNSFSFLSNEKGPFTAYIILKNKIYDKKIVHLEDCHSFYFDKVLKYNEHYKFVVEGNSTKNELEFETPIKLNAPFIKPNNKEIFSPIFIKQFKINKAKKIEKARLYITGLGLYQAFINENKVGNAYLTPGFNDYDYYLRYQTYNITKLLNEDNIIEIHMGNGWYKGRIGLIKEFDQTNLFGDEYKLCLNILIEYKDKTIENIKSDDSWKVKYSKEVNNSIYDGEEVDFTLPEKPLENVNISIEKYNLIPDFGQLIVQKDILFPELYISPKGEKILDFKQNMVGFVRFKGSLERDQEIIMSHGEILQDNCFFNENLRSAKQILKYKGDGQKRIYEPKFTFFGFRYVLIKGLNKVNPKDFEGIVIYSDLEKTIKCKTDNDKINKLIKNSFWGQRSNFLDVPTDCPQRDERMGWTADTQVFVNTACFNMDSYLFYKKYMFDLRGDQTMYYLGEIPAYSPSLKDQANEGGAVWADAATIIPWNFYLNYGDKRILNYFYPMMKDYVETLREKDIEQGNTNLILEGFTYGDWLALDNENPESKFGGTDNGFIMSVYYYHSVELLTLVARELGNNKDYKNYNILKNRIYKALLNKYFSKEGKLNLNTQTSFVLCLQYKIYIDKDIIIRQFKERIKNDYYKIKTGFTGTPFILLTLFDNDMDDIAYRILFNENYPGWLYSINLGATTIWERWNSLLENGTISNTKMNSFNHYAYGSVCESIYSRIAGLRNNGPGWKKVIIQPHLNYRMKNIEFFYNSINGKFEINWSWKDDKFDLNVIIPNGVDAEIILPNNEKFNVKGGHFNFTCNLNKKLYSPFSIDTPIIDIINNKKGAKIIKKLLPKIYDITINNTTEIDNIRTLNILKGFNYPKKIINECNEMLSAIRP